MTMRAGTLGLRQAIGLALMISALGASGCGGEVVEPLDESNSSSEGGTGSGSGSGKLNGSCVTCDGQAECRFCLVKSYNATFICPLDKTAPRPGCLDLSESYTSSSGEPYTCYYCN